ncbi:TraB/GumN family protein [Paenibacillus arenilitoris]|uniref:TraB/GumN family protein n=1 Tax=Paenibacillus arenilitoris TaxID=2772299 RepID=A0A927CNI4_9BACL|nr:TraB/GumN family protein [Paenibacillus arenilitoris]MBD2869406.1 TraB/GumN family protein [Paenibacillus arenilitoris]
MKKMALWLAALALLFSFATGVQAEAKPVTVWIGDERLELEEGLQPLIEQGTTLVPAEPLLEELAFAYSWDEQTQAATGTKEGLTVTLRMDDPVAHVNEEERQLVVVPRLVKGTAYVPLRFVGEAAGYEVSWNGENRAVTLEEDEPSVGFLWKAENSGNTVYLLGSIHVASEAMYPLRPEIMEAYEASDILVVEADIRQANVEANRQLVVDLSAYKDGTTLKDHIAEDTYKKLVQLLKENGMEETAMDAFKPWSVSSTIDYLTTLKSGYDAGIGIDAYFLEQATESGQAVVELESIEAQLRMFDEFSPELQEQMLTASIEGYYAEESSLEQLTETWATGDEAQLLALTNEAAMGEELYKAMLEDRNKPMVEKIAGFLNGEEKNVRFVVVGAAHMLGEHGIVPQLEQAGFTVTRQ